MSEAKEIDCRYTGEIVCPYCGHEQSDSWEMGEDGETDCGNCEKAFVFTRDVEVTYISQKLCRCLHAQVIHKMDMKTIKNTLECLFETYKYDDKNERTKSICGCEGFISL